MNPQKLVNSWACDGYTELILRANCNTLMLVVLDIDTV